MRVSPNTDTDRLAAKGKIDFANGLLNSNPECLDLKESLLSASLFLDGGNYSAAEASAQKAISGCSGIMALRGAPTMRTETITQADLVFTAVAFVVTMGLMASIGLALFMYMRKRKDERQKAKAEPHRAAEEGNPHG